MQNMERSENSQGKNRYGSIAPFKHTKVALPQRSADANDGYINANYVQSALGKKRFIATQGPLPETKENFWRMVWAE